MDLSTEVQAVREAIQNLLNAIEDEPHLLDSAVVVWEAVSFDEDGDPQRCISYTVPTDNFLDELDPRAARSGQALHPARHPRKRRRVNLDGPNRLILLGFVAVAMFVLALPWMPWA